MRAATPVHGACLGGMNQTTTTETAGPLSAPAQRPRWTHTVYLSDEAPVGHEEPGDRVPVHCTRYGGELRAVGCALKSPGQVIATGEPGAWYSRDGRHLLVWTRPDADEAGWVARAPSYPAWVRDPSTGLLGPVVVTRGDLVGEEIRVVDAPWPEPRRERRHTKHSGEGRTGGRR